MPLSRMSACPQVRVSACPRVRMSACPHVRVEAARRGQDAGVPLIAVNGIELYCESHGTGAPLVVPGGLGLMPWDVQARDVQARD